MIAVSQDELDRDRVFHEVEFVRAFIPSDRRERAIFLLADSKRRRKFTDKLAHFDGFERKYVTPVTPSVARSATEMTSLLRTKGAGEGCWIISERGFLDRRKMQLDDALSEVWGGSFGTIVSCVPGKLAFFRNEEMKSELLLQRP